jgi:branched-chain amino acid transport system permease protein
VAIREDQDAARMLGINTTLFKVIAYALSAVFAALAGGLTAYQNIHVTPGDFFKIDYTLQMIIATIIGGAGTVLGPVLGAAVCTRRFSASSSCFSSCSCRAAS